MANPGLKIERPVQIILDTQQYMERPNYNTPGGKTDFFHGRDSALKRHKEKIQQQLVDVADGIERTDSNIGFVVVQMHDKALAKSHRPTRKLFTPNNRFSSIGTRRIGEMIFQCTPQAARNLATKIERTVEEISLTKIDEKTGEIKPNPSTQRADLSAIATVSLYSASDRLTFSAPEALQWIRTPGVIGNYILELFRPDVDLDNQDVLELFDHLSKTLMSFGGGLIARRATSASANNNQLAVSVVLTANPDLRLIQLDSKEWTKLPRDIPPELDAGRHQEFLKLMASEPIVRSIDLPVQVMSHPVGATTGDQIAKIQEADPDTEYPIVGIIDGGVAGIPALSSWRHGTSEYVLPKDQEYSHGTFIAGLLNQGRNLNPEIAGDLESIPCKFFDIAAIPRDGLLPQYYSDSGEFLDQLEEEVSAAKNKYGVRVFNISLGMPGARKGNSYSLFASELDRISREHDVIFVVSAGNLRPGEHRPPWPKKPTDVLEMVAVSSPQDDRITSPGEHLLGLTVGAINPPTYSNHYKDVPTTYTRRGPGVAGARKPDLVHYGGIAATSNSTGLRSLDVKGNFTENRGTSFAAPSVAATTASLDFLLNGEARRETLLALLVHRAERPPELENNSLRPLAREFVGFGRPAHALKTLSDENSAITLVFSDILKPQQELLFNFVWPERLVTPTGACKGHIDLTLAYTPPIDQAHDQECLRVQLEAQLQQIEVNPDTLAEKHVGQLKPIDTVNGKHTEAYMLKSGLKWTPIKKYNAKMPNGRGKSSTWRLWVHGQTRALTAFPKEGVPFTAVLTIRDPKSTEPIYSEFRNSLLNLGVKLEDIQITQRLRN